MNAPLILAAVLAALFVSAVPSNGQERSRDVPAVHDVFLEKLKIPLSEVERMQREKTLLPPRPEGAARKPATLSETVVSDDVLPESEVHALINPADPSNIVVAPMRLSRNQQEALLCPVYYSKDFGATWRKSTFKNVPKETGAMVLGGGDPVFAAAADGTLYFTWINVYLLNFTKLYMGMYWVSSTDGGETWERSADDLIGRSELSAGGNGTEAFDKQWLAVDRSTSPYRNTLYAAMFHPDAGGVKIAVRRKPPDSAGFLQQSVRVSQSGYKFAQFASIGIDETGGVHVSYFGSEDSNAYAMYHAVSVDGARTFSEPVKISDVNMPRFSLNDRTGSVPGFQDARVYPCPHLVIDQSGGPRSGFLYAVWTGNGITRKEAHGLDIFLSRSTDKGASWSPPRIVNDDARGVVVDQFHPSVAVNANGILAVTWYDRREDVSNRTGRYYYAASTDGGISFAPNRPVADLPMDFTKAGSANGGFAVGEYNQLLITNEYLIPVWADGRANDGNLNILAAFIPVSAATHAERIASVSDRFSLAASYPNPARDGTSVSFTLASHSRVRLVLHDALGRSVRVLEDGNFHAGSFTSKLATADLPSGTYRLTLQTDYGVAQRNLDILH